MKTNRKGAVIVIVIVFMIVASITSLALYNSVYNVSRMQGIGEVRRIRGYYLADAGKIYASMLLKDPVGNVGFNTLTTSDSEVTEPPISMTANNPTLASNLGLTGSEDVTIKITERPSDGKYDIESEYSY